MAHACVEEATMTTVTMTTMLPTYTAVACAALGRTSARRGAVRRSKHTTVGASASASLATKKDNNTKGRLIGVVTLGLEPRSTTTLAGNQAAGGGVLFRRQGCGRGGVYCAASSNTDADADADADAVSDAPAFTPWTEPSRLALASAWLALGGVYGFVAPQVE